MKPFVLFSNGRQGGTVGGGGVTSPDIASRPLIKRSSAFIRIGYTKILEHICMTVLKSIVSGRRGEKTC